MQGPLVLWELEMDKKLLNKPTCAKAASFIGFAEA
jgi:hypothetical protein